MAKVEELKRRVFQQPHKANNHHSQPAYWISHVHVAVVHETHGRAAFRGLWSCRLGLVSPDAVEKAMKPTTICISIMHSNNETGALQPIKELVTRARRSPKHIYVHCDASQSLGKLQVDVNELGVDFLTIAGHKLYAPKGVGALYKRCSAPEPRLQWLSQLEKLMELKKLLSRSPIVSFF